MAIRNIRREATRPGGYEGTKNAAPIYVDSDDNILKMVPAGSGTTEVQILDASSAQTLTNKTLTSPVLNTPTVKDLTEAVTATNVIGAAETGTVFFLNSATEFVSTLPAPAAGLRFTFIVKAAPASASYTIVSDSGTDNIHGAVYAAEDALGSGDATSGTAADTITFVDGKAQVGDMVELYCDGTLWYAKAFATQQDAITFTA